ncbi:di-heme oxidoredictase family protein [Tistrella bauzanensis]
MTIATTRGRWIRSAGYAAGMIAVLGVQQAASSPPPIATVDIPAEVAEQPDPHLWAVPRTKAERARIAAVIRPTTDFTRAEEYEVRPGGAATTMKQVNRDIFSQSSANMPFESELDFKVGNGLFRKIWVSSPSSTRASDGLGPLFNARSCQSCHIKDGRGHPPAGEDDDRVSIFLRLSVPPRTDELKAAIAAHLLTVVPEPSYGGQLQDLAVQGVPSEGRMEISYREMPVTLSDGETASLRVPTYSIGDPGYGPLDPEVMLSPRVAPPMIGLGLLEAVPARDILANADPDDADADGISGRPNFAFSPEFQRVMLGRFGWKAGTPTIRQQSADAFAGDMGISNDLHPAGYGECTEAQMACRDAPDGADADDRDGFEIDGPGLDLVTFYSRNLAVPARRDVDDPQVLRGKQVFNDTGCIACHTPKFVTARLTDRPEQSFQLIWPYSDLLLHDMGPGLADDRPEGAATGFEWRTAPLWGIGLTATVDEPAHFLHDGRARSLLEAVLWHGGEAEAQKQAVMTMPKPDRDALIRFLESL